MSLINQMLKDLDQQRKGKRPGAKEVFSGVSVVRRYPGISMGLRSLLGAILLVIAAIAYWYWHQPQLVQPHEKPIPVKPIKVAQVVKPEVAAKPAVEKSVPLALQKPQSAPVVTKPPVVAPIAVVNKTVRPLSPQQLQQRKYHQAMQWLAQGKQQQAMQSLKAILASDANFAPAREALATLLIKYGQLSRAEQLIADGLQRFPGNTTLAQLQARILLAQHQPQVALKVLQRAMPTIQANPQYHALTAMVLRKLGKVSQSAEIYTQLLQLDPHNGAWWAGFGISLEQMGRLNQAIEAYVRASQSQGVDSVLQHYVNSRIQLLRGSHA